jgi:hypothetical protein
MWTDDGGCIAELLQSADRAMYRVKRDESATIDA